jgi:pimeloyl-[acyl-carrier protein] methyl ester esterase
LRLTDLREHLAEIRQPTLVLHGGLDRIIPVGAGRQLGERLPTARYVEWPDVGHAPFLSRPRQSVSLWREFLA